MLQPERATTGTIAVFYQVNCTSFARHVEYYRLSSSFRIICRFISYTSPPLAGASSEKIDRYRYLLSFVIQGGRQRRWYTIEGLFSGKASKIPAKDCSCYPIALLIGNSPNSPSHSRHGRITLDLAFTLRLT